MYEHCSLRLRFGVDVIRTSVSMQIHTLNFQASGKTTELEKNDRKFGKRRKIKTRIRVYGDMLIKTTVKCQTTINVNGSEMKTKTTSV